MLKIEVQTSNQASPKQDKCLKHCDQQFFKISSSTTNEDKKHPDWNIKNRDTLNGPKSDANDFCQYHSGFASKAKKSNDVQNSKDRDTNFTETINDLKFSLDSHFNFSPDAFENNSMIIGNSSISPSSLTFLSLSNDLEPKIFLSSSKNEVPVRSSSGEIPMIGSNEDTSRNQVLDIRPKVVNSLLGKRNLGNKLSSSSPEIRTVSLNSFKCPESSMISSKSGFNLGRDKYECDENTKRTGMKKSKRSSSVSSKYMLQRKPPKSPFEEYLIFLKANDCQCAPIPSLDIKNFFLQPTKRDMEAYDKESIAAIRAQDIPKLKEMYESGKSMQCCNSFGESLIHMACRRGYTEVVRFLITQANVSIRVRDDFGRTPLHDACWTPEPNFELMDLLITKDSDLLLISDKRGHTPLQYVRKEDWGKWKEFLSSRRKLLLPKHFSVK